MPDHDTTLVCEASSRASYAAAFAVRALRHAPDMFGAARRAYDPVDVATEDERALMLAHDGPVPEAERRAAARRFAVRRALLAEPRGALLAVGPDVARREADISRYRRADVVAFRRVLKHRDETWFPRLTIAHDKRVLRLLVAKLREAEAIRAALVATAGLKPPHGH